MSNEENEQKKAGQGGDQKSRPEIRYVPLDIRSIEEDNDDEIDLIELVKTVWDGRRLIVISVVLFVVIGLIVAIGSPDVYTSEVKIMPEAQEGNSLGSLGGLAAQFGIAPRAQNSGQGISPNMYPEIIQSNLFLQDLSSYTVALPASTEEVSLSEYLSEHQEGSISLSGLIIRYTIMLPFTLKNHFFSDEEMDSEVTEGLFDTKKENRILRLSEAEWGVLRQLQGIISIENNSETGLVTVSVDMQNPQIAADVADEVVQRLSEYVIEKRTEKARENAMFIRDRFEEARGDFMEAQNELAEFNDSNQGQLTAMARTREQLLQSRYNLSFNLYNSLAERLEEANIRLQEEIPVITIIEPAAVPDTRSEPNRTFILLTYTIMGIILGVVLIFGLKFWKTIQEKLKGQ